MNKTMKIMAALLLMALGAAAQKSLYVPNEWKNPRAYFGKDSLIWAESDPDNKYTWSKTRSVESDNVIVLWDKGYGNTLPSKAPSAYRVDEQDLLRKCEAFFDLEINTLGFVNPTTSNLAKYKVMVLLNHTTEWVCNGAGYDYQVSAFWLSPWPCQPVGFSVAHELGHSFQYMCFSEHGGHRDSQTDNTGFHLRCGNGQTIWEQTAQWQAAQSYPEQMFSESIGTFRKSHNYAFSHEWHRYQSYWFLYYLCQYYNDLTTVAQVWNQPMTGQAHGTATDFNRALMRLKGLSVRELFSLYYDYAARCATWDFDACAPYRNTYIGDLQYRCVQTADHAYQVALASAPQSSGFNVIPLQVPQAGTTVTTRFIALKNAAPLAQGDPAEMLDGDGRWVAQNRTNYVPNTNNAYRAFRLGYVALMDDGSRRYFHADSLYCQGTAETTADITMEVPDGTSRLWLVVSPAPKRYTEHRWTDSFTNAEQWPYSFELTGTDLGGQAIVYMDPVIDGRTIGDITLTYDVYYPPTTGSDHQGTTLTLAGRAAAMLGTALQLQPQDIASKMQAYSSAGPTAGHIMFYPCHPVTGARINRGSTANGYGHWFNASGIVCDYGSGYVFSEFQPSSLTFSLGCYPGKTRHGNSYTITQALRYKKSATEEATARFVFRIHIDSGRRGAELAQVDYQDVTAIGAVRTSASSAPSTIYDLSGRRLAKAPHHGLFISSGRLQAPTQ